MLTELRLQWYISVIREQTQRDVASRPFKDRTEIQNRIDQTDAYWGYFWCELGYTMGPQFDSMTLAQAAHAEFSAVERILARAFSRIC